jgi:hypothetical protein
VISDVLGDRVQVPLTGLLGPQLEVKIDGLKNPDSMRPVEGIRVTLLDLKNRTVMTNSELPLSYATSEPSDLVFRLI